MRANTLKFIKNEMVLILATLAALITMVFVPPSIGYVEYIDFKVIALLFCLMAVVAGFIRINLFGVISGKLLKKAKSVKAVAIILVNCTFFFSMLITNDVALITLVPLTIGLLSKQSKNDLIFVIVMETIAANLGSMITPIGNPQNLYLFSYFKMGLGEFLKTVLPVGIISYIIIMAIMLFMPNTDLKEISVSVPNCKIQSKPKLITYLLMFFACILTVIHILDYRVCLSLIITAVLIIDRKILMGIDYSLLLTFIAFFIFVGNLSNMETVKNFLSDIVNGRELILGAITSQVVSNVPTAIMLSGFTDNVKQLILGVNIGGLGTLVASLASLISFRIYAKSKGAKLGKFFLVFSTYNVLILAVLLACCYIFKLKS